ncbi:hypothetical protein F0U62_34335 [Cystobacter fuscus]|uniref:hypothetical protein n=1 Tax=Cystobacter fuscus TaxID=43 RepID=UPI002B2E7062|nr:hypothetical protein F0U62_34335 [Cystobacter fuscus]
MAKEKHWTRDRLGSFYLGASHDELGPGLGRLYEAWQEGTGAPVLLLQPGANVNWQPEGPLRIQLSFDPRWSTVSVKVEEAPAPPDLSDVANILVLTTAAITRVEDNPQVRAHVASSPRPHAMPSAPPPPEREPRFGRGLALAALLVLSLGLGVWLCAEHGSAGPGLLSSAMETEGPSKRHVWILGNSKYPGADAIGYPMPATPFDNQSTKPCYPELDEVEINGGCWFTVERRPPCLKDVQAEYKGKCYLPISKDRGKKPVRSIEP